MGQSPHVHYIFINKRGWGGRLFEAGCLLTFPTYRVGTYSRWALIRGWALNQINTVVEIKANIVVILGHLHVGTPF